MKKKTSILFILTLSFGICFALILSMRSVLVHSTPLTHDTITNDNNNNIPATQKNSTAAITSKGGLDVIGKTTASSKKSNNTFLATGSIASLLINTKESTPSGITGVNESNAIYNATITNASRGSSVNNGMVSRVEGNHTKAYNNNSTSPSESYSILNSNIFTRTLDSYNSTSTSQNLDDSMINLLTKLIMGSMISGSSPTNKYPESITQAASTTQTETEKPFILTGDWNLSVKNGKVRDFTANFTMLHIDGTGSHVIKLINFQADANRTVYLGSDGTASIIGTVDVELNGTDKWKGVHTIIVIERLNTIYVVLDSNATANYFKGQPIYGITGLLKEDKNGDRLL
jgi:hypothetical protein